MKAQTRNYTQPLAPSELVLNKKGHVYHLDLDPHQVADNIILVGDPGRVLKISSRFDTIEHKVEHREFVTHTGRIGSTLITVLATGIGIDNIDIVLNELDALTNVDLETRQIKPSAKKLNLIRLGTSGALQPDIEVGSAVHSRYAIGLDGLLHHYALEYEADEKSLIEKFIHFTKWQVDALKPYAVRGADFMDDSFSKFSTPAITLTANGFYGPQGRQIRLPSTNTLNDAVQGFQFKDLAIGNYEMETSALFGLGGALGHHCTTICLAIANRLRNEFLGDYSKEMDGLIEQVLEAILSD